MPGPLVSVVMPVHNTAPFLKKAVESMLNQDYGNIELILIDDGSTDHSAEVLAGLRDSRIRLFRNEGNMGLVYTLNRGLALANGTYIARMDGDDQSLPGRISSQVAYLDAHPEAGVVAARVELIDEQGNPIGVWEDESRHTTARDIRNFLPLNNCIAHPSVMARASLLKKYAYRQEQAQSEDYDLWLRMAADGIGIHKIGEVLLRHRIVSSSYTRKRQKNVFGKLAETKRRFALHAIAGGRINGFVLKTLFHSGIDSAKALIKPTARTHPCIT